MQWRLRGILDPERRRGAPYGTTASMNSNRCYYLAGCKPHGSGQMSGAGRCTGAWTTHHATCGCTELEANDAAGPSILAGDPTRRGAWKPSVNYLRCAFAKRALLEYKSKVFSNRSSRRTSTLPTGDPGSLAYKHTRINPKCTESCSMYRQGTRFACRSDSCVCKLKLAVSDTVSPCTPLAGSQLNA